MLESSLGVAGGLPHHIAIIPDGNRRWALRKGLPPEEGHRRGFLEITPALLRELWNHGLHTVTLWLFSTENWRRSEGEVRQLMLIYEELWRAMIPVAQELRVRIRHTGRKDRIPESLLAIIVQAERETASLADRVLNLCLDYGGRDEIVRLVSRILNEAPAADSVSESLIDSFIGTLEQLFPFPDLIIRTSGEYRLSGFLPWHSSYSELFFLDICYPDLAWSDVAEVLSAYSHRQRRFGA